MLIDYCRCDLKTVTADYKCELNVVTESWRLPAAYWKRIAISLQR